jgi:hypothetical protein
MLELIGIMSLYHQQAGIWNRSLQMTDIPSDQPKKHENLARNHKKMPSVNPEHKREEHISPTKERSRRITSNPSESRSRFMQHRH